MSRDTAPSLQDIAHRVRMDTSATWAWINVVDGDHLVTAIGDGTGHERVTGRRHRFAETLVARVATSGHDVLVINDTFDSATDWQMRARVIRVGLGPCVLALVRDADGELLGAVTVGRRSGDRAFDDVAAAVVAKAAAEVRPLLAES